MSNVLVLRGYKTDIVFEKMLGYKQEIIKSLMEAKLIMSKINDALREYDRWAEGKDK